MSEAFKCDLTGQFFDAAAPRIRVFIEVSRPSNVAAMARELVASLPADEQSALGPAYEAMIVQMEAQPLSSNVSDDLDFCDAVLADDLDAAVSSRIRDLRAEQSQAEQAVCQLKGMLDQMRAQWRASRGY